MPPPRAAFLLVAFATAAPACGSDAPSPDGAADRGAGASAGSGGAGAPEAAAESAGGAGTGGASGADGGGGLPDGPSDVVAEGAPPDAPPDAPPGWKPAGKNVPSGYLCDILPDYVQKGGDPVNPPCQIESDFFSDRDPSQVPAKLRLVAWNVEYGKSSATVEQQLLAHAALAGADFVLLTEVARGDLASVPQNIDQARDLAKALKMNYLFAVEWDRRLNAGEKGEHGVAILSKYPLGDVVPIRHTPLNDWYKEDNRFGGRVTLGADALVGGKLLRVYASHLCTRGTGDAGRAMQAAETRKDADLPGRPAEQVVGGDLNTWTCNPTVVDCTKPPAAEQLVKDFLAAGWKDGTEGFKGYTQLGKGFFPQRLDWIFYRGAAATPGSCAQDAKGSDHFPVHFQVAPP